MKTILKILGGLAVVLIIAIIGLNLYFTDARLKSTVMPYVDDAIGRNVQVESMSLTFFSTFPQPGLSISKMSIPGDTEGDTLVSLDELVVGVQLFSLFGDEISISEIKLQAPKFTYKIYEDSTSNIDFLMAGETEEDTTAGLAISIPYFKVSNAQIGYTDETSNTNIRLNDLNADISLRYADLIESTVDIQLGGLSASAGGTQYVNGLPLSLSEESTIDLENETVNLQKGTLSIRGLALNLAGTIPNWGTSPEVDLTFNTSSDNFGELLRLIPKEYEEYIKGLETRGSLAIDGSVNGIVGGEQLPSFDAKISVTDGYIKNPELPQPIEGIQLNAEATNDLLTVSTFNARAGENSITATGKLTEPFAESGTFSLDTNGDINLATIQSFYDISQFDVEKLQGQLNFKANAKGSRSKPEEANFDASIKLADGLLQYKGVPKPVENINVDARANQDRVTINSMSLDAAANTFSMNGTVNSPLDEANRTINLETNLKFDLASIKDFYPISEDTLRMSGMLTAQASLKGNANRIEQSVESGSINLKNGMIDYKKIGQPIRDITLESVLEGPRLTIVSASFKTGENNMKASGLINNYLSESRTIDLRLEGFARLDEITNYYQLEPTISTLTGTADLNLRAKGRVDQPAGMVFNGGLEISNMSMEGEALVQPIQKLNGKLTLSPSAATLENLSFNFGSSDIRLSGSLKDYMEYLKTEENRKATPHLTGTYQSNYLNVDEIIDWEDTTESGPVPIELPDLTSSVTASIDKMLVTGVTMQNLEAKAGTTPKQIKMEQASMELFEGKVSGSFVWDVPQPDHTMITFKGKLENVRAESFFKEYQVLGEKSEFHKYISGAFSAEVDYYSDLDVYLSPVIETTKANGNFGMTKSRLKGHPLQEQLAVLLKSNELRNIALDEWKSTFTIDNSILTFKDLKLTSGDIGAEMSGTQHMVKETIDYDMKLFLPGRFKGAIASVISEQAANALQQENGTIMVPLSIKGTMDNPRITPDQNAIKPIIKEFLKDKAGNALKKLFGGDG